MNPPDNAIVNLLDVIDNLSVVNSGYFFLIMKKG